MRAVVARAFGGPDVLEIIDVPVPTPGPGQVRIRVQAATVNPVDAATRAGLLAESGLMAPRDTIGIGWDAAGTIDATGPGVTTFTTGDAVIGLSDRLDVPLGTHADYVVLDADAVAPAPAGIPATHAATLPLNGLTAAQALDLLDLPRGATLLVTGAAGAVGGFTVELAAHRGLRVVAVAGPGDERLVRDLGAEWFVPRTAADLPAEVRAVVAGGVDAAVDAAVIGPRALEAVRNRGAFVAVVAGAAPVPLRGTRVSNVWITADGAQLAELSALAAGGHLTLRVADTLPLKEAALAHRKLDEGGLRGRLVLTAQA
ncbi:NADP-dependent oxidoreductase [Actinomadura rudentiformis]|uniref:NADP-dependent oxidoreductase n=1 Tax=Actinomadura rudentiformis TaxID=359158 RepID=A0A6H9YXY5_9ACTN|nr:NADP-dependent oxidoreductase [Actinomadura rudentiformis]KAB2349012.1 NADP-dependent oxidoreductase [Actinomadura rudentiformis]